MKHIGILTSSRADYGIYLPLLKALREDTTVKTSIIVFGTHLSPFHGMTVNQILTDGFLPAFRIESLMAGDTENAVSTSMALTSLKFSDFWRDHNDFDIVFCLGDRFEMFSAVIAGIPYNIKFAHIHGGEKTLGAIDNIFRDSITLASRLHFVSCGIHAERVSKIIDSDKNIFNVGALSLDNLKDLKLLTQKEFILKYRIDLNDPTILVTFHPETINPEKNIRYADELTGTLLSLKEYQVIISLPNADTFGSSIRSRMLQIQDEDRPRIHCIENLGSQSYFSAMKLCSFLLGNSSSAIIEAASFGKWVINLGDRQKGRVQNPNVLNVPFDRELIMKAVRQIEAGGEYEGGNIYFQKDIANNIWHIVKKTL